jgi:hypothetical protein
MDKTFVVKCTKVDHGTSPYNLFDGRVDIAVDGNTKGGSITVQLTPCLTGLESAV